MRAAFIETQGDPDHIQIGALPTPTPNPDQALVRVRAVSVNPIDTYIRSGAIPMPVPLPYIIGCDFAGEIVRLGANVRGFRVGQQVWGSNQGLMGRQGTFSEWAAIDAHWLHSIPEGVSPETMAASALVGITAHLGLFSVARLQPGQTVFIHGASGAVGSTVVQLARACGAHPIAATGNLEKADALRAIGASAVLDYRDPNFDTRLRECATEGVDLWWETSREPNFDRIIPAMRRGGRIVLMAGRAARPAFPVGPFYVNNLSLHGFAMFNFSPEEQRGAASDLARWIADGVYQPRIDRILELSEAAESHRIQENATLNASGELAGKMVLTIGD